MLPLMFATPQTEAAYRFEARPTDGLRVSVRGVPVVDGSWFQLYAPDWSKQFLASSQGGQVSAQADGTVQLQFRSADGLASATQTFCPEGDRLKMRYRF